MEFHDARQSANGWTVFPLLGTSNPPAMLITIKNNKLSICKLQLGGDKSET